MSELLHGIEFLTKGNGYNSHWLMVKIGGLL